MHLFSFILSILILVSCSSSTTSGLNSSSNGQTAQSSIAANALDTDETNQAIVPIADAGNYTNSLSVSYIDVGQGDSIFIVLPNGKTMLIDAGDKGYSSEIIN